jgi:alpha-ketoglutarate-dependent 2,4-dichlorophenoxyacetate dioxygenase
MSVTFRSFYPHFVAEVIGVDVRQVFDQESLAQLRAGLDQYGVLIFHDQPLTNEEHLAFAQRLDYKLHFKGNYKRASRWDNDAIREIGNLDENGEIMKVGDSGRMYGLGNRLWHTDVTFRQPPGRYSLLSAKVVPPVAADTEFADMRAAYEGLPTEQQLELDGLSAEHSLAYLYESLGFELSNEQREAFKGAVQPLVRTNQSTRRKSLYLAAYASRIMDWPVPEGRLLLHDLMEHSTGPEFVYAHHWRADDLVIWDNRATMHRGRPFDDQKYRRELRRVMTVDVDEPT